MTQIKLAASSGKCNYNLPRNGRNWPAVQIFNRNVVLVEVAPNGTPDHFSATVNDRLMVPSSRQPLLDACRALLAEGADSNGWVVMVHLGSPIEALRTKVGIAAQLTVEDDHGQLKFRRWRGPRGTGTAPPMLQPALADAEAPAP